MTDKPDPTTKCFFCGHSLGRHEPGGGRCHTLNCGCLAFVAVRAEPAPTPADELPLAEIVAGALFAPSEQPTAGDTVNVTQGLFAIARAINRLATVVEESGVKAGPASSISFPADRRG